MKVKELIALLNTLDQEKEIKAVVADGRDLEFETADEIKIVPYGDTEIKHDDGNTHFPIWNYDPDKLGNDFYLIQGENI